MKLFAYDGRLATGLLTIFQFFIVSVQVVACAVPAMVFQALVGWQPTHLAVWLGALSLAPIGPGMFAALVSMRAQLVARGYPGRPVSRFWSAWALGAGRLAWWWGTLMSITILLGYDVALYGPTTPLLLAVAVMAAVFLVVTIELSIAVQRGDRDRPAAALARAARALCRRPHVALGWVGVAGLGALAMALPVVGPSAALFVPAVWAWAVLVLDAAFHPNPEPEETRHA